MLIPCDRFLPGDIEAWEQSERVTRMRLTSARERARLLRMGDEAMKVLREFFVEPGYVGVSWGKDSVVVAHLARLAVPHVPHVWCRLGRLDNPHCVLVRDVFCARFDGRYDEIVTEVDASVETGRLLLGFAEAARRHGDRYASGVRSEESRTRKLRQALHGTTSARTCAPITRWTGDDVFAWLQLHELPVHPAYAMTRGGALDRRRIRVASIGGERGTGHGRRQWEAVYYEPELFPASPPDRRDDSSATPGSISTARPHSAGRTT